MSGAIDFEARSEEKGLDAYLANVSLVMDIDNMEEDKDNVALMTLHSAKGLEFPVVFIPGFEENVFPGTRSMESDTGLEEERRLCYVGITRAMEKLCFTSAHMRKLFGSTSYNRCSRFMEEIPDELITVSKSRRREAGGFTDRRSFTWDPAYGSGFSGTDAFGGTGGSGFAGKGFPGGTGSFRPVFGVQGAVTHAGKGKAAATDYKEGERVVHKKFGVGRISAVIMDKGDQVLEIEFKNHGMKRLMAEFANLVKL